MNQIHSESKFPGTLCQALSRQWVTPAVLAALVAGIALTATSCKKSAPAQLPAPVVQVLTMVPINAPANVEFIGLLDSPQNVEVRARVEAFVDQVLFTEGTAVKAGDPLFKLDDRPSRERLTAAQGLYAEAQATLHKYEKDVARLTPLAVKRAIPQQDLDNALASVEVGKAGVLSAQSRMESAQFDLEYCDVRAPISGMIGAKQASIGELVGKGQPTLLATISQLDPIWFYCAVSEVTYLMAERHVAEKEGRIADLPVTLVLSDGSEHPAKGKFVFIDRAVDSKTGTLRVRAEFPNPRKSLRPGMFARVKVELGSRPDSIVVPQRALTELQGKSFVWVIGADNKAILRAVKVGDLIDSSVLIVEGLKPGERIVVEGLQKVREGAAVQPMTAEEMALAAAKNKQAEAKPSQE